MAHPRESYRFGTLDFEQMQTKIASPPQNLAQIRRSENNAPRTGLTRNKTIHPQQDSRQDQAQRQAATSSPRQMSRHPYFYLQTIGAIVPDISHKRLNADSPKVLTSLF